MKQETRTMQQNKNELKCSNSGKTSFSQCTEELHFTYIHTPCLLHLSQSFKNMKCRSLKKKEINEALIYSTYLMTLTKQIYRKCLLCHMMWCTTVQNKQDDIYKDKTKNTIGVISKDTRENFKY